MSLVKAWKEQVVIPTYEIGAPEKNPIFLQKRVYQGSSGAVYPHPVVEKISDQKTDKTYNAFFLENEYLRIMILPELGGRIQRAYDKIRNRDFIYYNQVIKPALVGLTGPWISGGIEFNWPQHHRPSTFEPVDADIEENEDGSKTVWVNEVELMTRTKGMAGFTLYPGKAYLEVKARLHNRTHLPQTFLWWANPAVKVNDHYQSVFPPDVHAVFDHGKRDVSDFPIATGTYYKVNYAPGTDISRYKNIPVPTSFMAVYSDYDFIGCYEHDTQAGMLHVANHHVVPGKKQWTWGNGDFGKAWDRNLTDEDGPYIELMCGAFTDNQPDFSWLQPNEQKTFEQYFLPYAGIGAVKNASREAAVNLETDGDIAQVKVYVTSEFDNAEIELVSGNEVLFKKVKALSPAEHFEAEVKVPAAKQAHLFLQVKDATGAVLVSYKRQTNTSKPIPDAAQAAKRPAEVESNELLFLNGLHLEQYRHATYVATDYYQEALRRDASDIRNNNAMGLWLLRRAQFSKAEPFFRKAIQTLTLRNPNPYDGEPYYNLGVCLKMMDQTEEAYAMLYKSAWNDAMQHGAYLQLARIDCGRGKYVAALDLINKSISRNSNSHTALHLKSIILRKLNRTSEAEATIAEALQIDRFNYGCLFERYLLHNRADDLHHMVSMMHGWFNNFVEYAIDYMHAGGYHEAIQLLQVYTSNASKQANPLAFYYMAHLHNKNGDAVARDQHLQLAASCRPDYCFPSKIEDVIVLQSALHHNKEDDCAMYYLGNFWYANDQYDDAISCWEQSASINSAFATVNRNLALAHHNKRGNVPAALRYMERAFTLDKSDARILMELDQLYKICNRPPQARLALLQSYESLVHKRDDLYLEVVTLLNQLGRYDEAKTMLAERRFHPWEGGEGKTVTQYLWCHFELAKQALLQNQLDRCLALIDEATVYPFNLGEGKLPGTQENDWYYLRGCCYEKMGMQSRAIECFESATQGISEPVQAIFYNDPQPDKIVYQGLAWLKLGKTQKAESIFKRLIEFGQQHLNDQIHIDYFAVSLPDLLVFDQNLNLKNHIHCLYLQALGKLGLMQFDEAEKLFDQVLQLNNSHHGAIIHRNMISFLQHQLTAA